MTIVWWHWLVLGFCLIGMELLVPSFTIIWFGLGAVVVGLRGAAGAGVAALVAGAALGGGFSRFHADVV